MKTFEEKVHDSEIKYHGRKTNKSEPSCPLACPSSGCHGVQVTRVNHPDDKRPNLFSVPTPVAMPCSLSPNGTGNQSEAPGDKANHVEAISDSLELAQIREAIHQVLTPARCLD